MVMTYDQIWAQYNKVLFDRKIYIKRMQTDGTYETSFVEVDKKHLLRGTVRSLYRAIPNTSYDFGRVEVSNANVQFLSPHRELSDEENTSSLFHGYLRDQSQLKIVDSLVDFYSTPGTRQTIDVTTFTGLIDAKTAERKNVFESFTVLDFLSTLSNINVSTLLLTQTTLNNLVYEIMNRSEFTKYFNVSNSLTYIDAGYNITGIDLAQYTGSVLEMLEDLSKGHSIFYVDPTDNYFYYKPVEATATVQYQFLERSNRKISIDGWKEGKDRQVNRWFWEGTAINAVRTPAPSVIKLGELNISGVTNSSTQQNILNHVLGITEFSKPYFKLTIPYLPTIKILDKVNVESFGFAPPDAARWGMFPWNGKRYRKSFGTNISRFDEWMVRVVQHNSNLTTELELEKVVN